MYCSDKDLTVVLFLLGYSYINRNIMWIITRIIQWMKWILPRVLTNGCTVYSCIFFNEINYDGSFHIPEYYQHVFFFTDHRTWNFFFIQESMCFYSVDSFFRFTHSSVNFNWFTFLSHQKFDDRHLFQPGTLCLVCYHFKWPQNEYFWEIKIFFVAINQFWILQSFDL